MPAVMRGDRRRKAQNSTRTGKAGAQPRRGPTAVKLHAARQFGIPPRFVNAVAVGVLVTGLSLVMFTGGRAQALGSAVGRAVDGRLAAAGFRLERVKLEGVSPEAAPAVKIALDLQRGQPLAGMDLYAVKARVESVGWVESAEVVRLLPDTLVVSVVERKRLAVWQHRGQASVIDASGLVIPEADPDRFADLPLVVGEGAAEAAGRVLPLVMTRPRLRSRLEALVRVDGRRWDLRLKDGGLIQLPAVGEDAALIQLDQLDQTSRVLELGFERIDLRDPEMIAVRPREWTTTGGVAVGV